MKVYIVTNIAFPNGMAPGNRIQCFAKALNSVGVDNEVIVYKRSERFGIPARNTIGEGMFEGIRFRYVGKTPLRSSCLLVRRINDVRDRLVLKHFLKKNLRPNDIIFMYAGLDVEYDIEMCKVAHSCSAYYVHELCEYPYGTGTETKATAKKRKIVETKLLPSVDAIIPISESLAEYARQYVSSSCIIKKIPIMVDYSKYELEDLSKQSEPYIFHAGTLSEQKDGILGMIEAFGLAHEKLSIPLRLLITGNISSSPHSSEIKALIDRYSLDGQVVFLGYLDEDEKQRYLQGAAFTIINKYPTVQNKYCFSTKLGEYLAAGKVVIITSVGEARNWLTDQFDSYIIAPQDNDLLASTIVKVLEDEDKRMQIGKNARQTCKNSFDFHAYGEVLKELLISLQRKVNNE